MEREPYPMPHIGADAIRELLGAAARRASRLGVLVVGLIGTVPPTRWRTGMGASPSHDAPAS